MPDSFAAKLTPAEDTAGKHVVIDQFKLTDIPKAMDKMGWTESARIMRHWLAGEAYVLDMRVKEGRIPASSLSQEKIYAEINFDWLYSATNRVEPVIEKFISQIKTVDTISDHIGLDYRFSDGFIDGLSHTLSDGLNLFIRRLKRLNLLDTDQNTLIDSHNDFNDKSALELDDLSQFRLFRVSTRFPAQITDELDDVYGTLGGFLIKVAATKFRTESQRDGYSTIIIDEIGLYIRDTYDFLNAGAHDQLLGYWNKDGVVKPSIFNGAFPPDFIDHNGKRYFKVTNHSFNKYRKLHKKGGDMMVYSNVSLVSTHITIKLNRDSFNEFKARERN